MVEWWRIGVVEDWSDGVVEDWSSPDALRYKYAVPPGLLNATHVLHSSITPSLHHPITPILHHSNPPSASVLFDPGIDQPQQAVVVNRLGQVIVSAGFDALQTVFQQCFGRNGDNGDIL